VSNDTVRIDGRWATVVDSPVGEQHVELDLAANGTGLTGTATQNGATNPIAAGRVDGSGLSWTVAVTQPFPMTLVFAVSVSGDDMTGTVTAGPFPAAPLTGHRA
jgi:hypothetical protein